VKKAVSVVLSISLLMCLLLIMAPATKASNWDDEVIIGLDSNPSTGYSWEAKFNDRKVQLVDHWYQDPEPSSIPMDGVPGIEYFRFKLLRGWTSIIMEYRSGNEVIIRRVFYIR